jgi:MoxR-like ATPase
MNSESLTPLLCKVWQGNLRREPHARRNVYVTGPPGCGKSETLELAFRRFAPDLMAHIKSETGSAPDPAKCRLWDCRLAYRDPGDFIGIPALRCGNCRRSIHRCDCNGHADYRTSWSAPLWLPMPDEYGIFLIDELPQATVIMQNAALQLCRDYCIGEYRFPRWVSIVAAGNRIEDCAGANRLTTALADRFHPHIAFTVDMDCWQRWAERAKVRESIRAFLRWSPLSLQDFNPQSKETVFASARSWAALSDLLSDLADDAPNQTRREVINGTVGTKHGAQYLAYEMIHSRLPTFDEVYGAPMTCKVPDDASGRWGIVTMLAAQAKSRSIPAPQMGPIVTFASRLASYDGGKELVGCLMTDLYRLNRAVLTDCPEYVSWATTGTNADIIINATRENGGAP